MKSDTQSLVQHVRTHLEWELDQGAIGLPVVASRASDHIDVPAASKSVQLTVILDDVVNCVACDLHRQRAHVVFARGNPNATLVFIGEGPGYHEDQRGEPFVGPAGQLLDKMIAAMGLGQDDVYICNVVKCRPPENRTPLPNEVAACSHFLQRQLDIIAPSVIIALGKCAAEALGCVDMSTRSWRGIWGSYNGISVMPTYHPAFLLRSPEFKRPVWEDLQKVMARLGQIHDH